MAAEPAAAERLRAVPAPEAEIEETHPAARAFLRGALYGVILLSPLPFGSVQSWAVLLLEMVAAFLGAVALWIFAPTASDPLTRRPLLSTWAPFTLAFALVVLGISQAVPGPWGRTSAPGATARADLEVFVPDSAPVIAPWSLAAPETVDATARLAAWIVLAFVAFVAFRRKQHFVSLAIAIVASALFQALYGSAEYLSGRQSIFFYKKTFYLESATGTFINRNHFAGYLALALPFVFFAASTLRARASSVLRRRLWAASGGVVAFVMWIGILVSQSRAGLAVAFVGSGVYLAFGRMTRRAALGVVGALALAVFFVLWRDVSMPASRFVDAGADLSDQSGRLAAWRESVAALAPHPVLGFGLGTFEAAFAAVSGREFGQAVYDHAHNDYLQILFEEGGLGLAVTLLLVVVIFRSSRSRHASAGAVVAALITLALHAFVDFSIRIPAIACAASIIAGAGIQGTRSRDWHA